MSVASINSKDCAVADVEQELNVAVKKVCFITGNMLAIALFKSATTSTGVDMINLLDAFFFCWSDNARYLVSNISFKSALVLTIRQVEFLYLELPM